jgi:superfamily II DNA helicase RecQ
MEKGRLRNSKMFNEMLESLHQRNLIELFVLDEVHCVKNMGEDFRPAYK